MRRKGKRVYEKEEGRKKQRPPMRLPHKLDEFRDLVRAAVGGSDDVDDRRRTERERERVGELESEGEKKGGRE